MEGDDSEVSGSLDGVGIDDALGGGQVLDDGVFDMLDALEKEEEEEERAMVEGRLEPRRRRGRRKEMTEGGLAAAVLGDEGGEEEEEDGVGSSSDLDTTSDGDPYTSHRSQTQNPEIPNPQSPAPKNVEACSL